MATRDVSESISEILENIISDQSLESLVNSFSKKFGLSFTNSKTQTAVYTLSTVALLETAQNVFGIGAGFTSLDLTGFTLAQIKSKLENIEQKLNIILDAPIKLALKHFSTAMTAMEFEDIEQTVAEMDKVRDQAMLSYEYSIPEQKWEQAVLATKLKIMSTIIKYSADKTSNTIIPFHVLKDNSKKKIAAEIEKDVIETLDLPQKIKSKRWIPMSDKRKLWAQNLANEILMPTYQYLSDGFGWSNLRSPPSKWEYKGCYLPLGAGYKATLPIVIEGKIGQVHLWREKDGAINIYLSCEAGNGPIVNGQWLPEEFKADRCYQIIYWINGWSNPRRPLNTWQFCGRYLPTGEKNKLKLSLEKNGEMEQVHLWKDEDVLYDGDDYIYVECAKGHRQCRKVGRSERDRVVTWSDVNTSCCDTRHHWTQVNVESSGKITWKVSAYKLDNTWYLPIYPRDGGGPWLRNNTNSSSSQCPVSGWTDADWIKVHSV